MTTVSFGLTPGSRRAYDAPLLGGGDGDTTYYKQAARLVSVDTPETSPELAIAQARLDRCRQRLRDGVYDRIAKPLRQHLIDRLTADAAQRHLDAGARAAEEFKRMQSKRLEVDRTGTLKIAVVATGEVFDELGRVLAYVAPWLSPPLPPRDDPRRRTFNLELIEKGWASLFLIYRSLPRDDDINRLLAAAEAAWEGRIGAWAEFGEDLLLGYEFRTCLKLGADEERDKPLTAPETIIQETFRRVCLDIRSRTILGRYGYHQIDPPYRLWVWEKDLNDARQVLQLIDE
jgi:endonuclease YncB( thermonuclease family)